jgi:hypothetical protein
VGGELGFGWAAYRTEQQALVLGLLVKLIWGMYGKRNALLHCASTLRGKCRWAVAHAGCQSHGEDLFPLCSLSTWFAVVVAGVLVHVAVSFDSCSCRCACC